MPRKPVEKVIEHRISLGGYERDRLDTFLTASSFNQVANPVVSLLSDATAMVSLMVLFGYFFPNWRTDPATGEPMTDSELLSYKDDQKGLSDYLEQQNLIGMAAGVLVPWGLYGAGVLAGPPGWAAVLVGALGGALAVEGAEEVLSDAERAKIWGKRQAAQIQLMLNLGWPGDKENG